jgi:branched-chain amino acid transport system ATP-binding protein
MLAVHGLQAGYGASTVLSDISLSIGTGEVVTLLGRNGMGKTTTVRAIMGMVTPRGGEVWFDGARIDGLASDVIARRGIGLVPEGRLVFPTLTVRENLVATAANRLAAADPWNLPRIYALFPRLAERAGQRGGTLSGGEQQMLAIGRALMTNPKLLILDEATEGLAPLIRDEIWHCVTELKLSGQSILIIDKNIVALKKLADRHHIVEKGQTVWIGNSAEMDAAPDMVHRSLGL